MSRFLLLLLVPLAGCSPHGVRVGAKKFSESVILAEMGARLAREADPDARALEVGATPVAWKALTLGEIDAYPEYTGTITGDILKADPPDLAVALAEHGVKMSRPLGYRNNYALGMRKQAAASLGITKISDLRNHPNLRFGFTNEFLGRADGWPGLKARYGLPQAAPSGMAHALAYANLANGSLDLKELYTTDGEIAANDLVVLADDLGFFPAYEAVWLYRADLEERRPDVVAQLKRLEGRISEDDMRAMNARSKGEGKEDERALARGFLKDKLGLAEMPLPEETLAGRVRQTTVEHLKLVVPSLLLAVAVAVPLGIAAVRRPALGRGILWSVGILQTIPALALLLFMIPVMKWLTGEGIGAGPAVAALFLYGLLPIVRNTHAGLAGIPPSLRESADALGLTRWAILRRIELPLAAPTILAGVRTAAVITIGGATLGGFIAAGGYGRPILRGLDKSDIPLMLEGAIPAAVMAVVAELGFGLVERLWRIGR